MKKGPSYWDCIAALLLSVVAFLVLGFLILTVLGEVIKAGWLFAF